jgi:hypothetical protein
MKRGIKTLAAALAIMTILTVPAFASNPSGYAFAVTAESGYTASFNDTNNKTQLTVKATGLTAGSQYLILVLKGDATSPTESNILYIDQAAADSSGTVTFDKVYPSTICYSKIYLAGDKGLTAVAAIASTAEKNSGDVDSSGQVDSFDVVTLARKVGKKTVTSYWTESAADVNRDGTIDSKDLVKVAQAVAKNANP